MPFLRRPGLVSAGAVRISQRFGSHSAPESTCGFMVPCTAALPMCRARQRPAPPASGRRQAPRSQRSVPSSPSQVEFTQPMAPRDSRAFRSPSSAVMVKETTPLPVISPEMRSAGGAFSGAIPSWSMGPAKAEPEMRMLVTLLLELGGKHENQQFQACCMESAPDCSSTCQRPPRARPAKALMPVTSPVDPSAARHWPLISMPASA
mmetsp:Transcript_135736/g.321639  ORF Transcript_135736/g.321639 Transcript_135736/m.321639 type:complete len:206 (+) Transcript_135736:3045-3662(+)